MFTEKSIIRNVLFSLLLLLSACSSTKTEQQEARLYLANYSFFKFDKAVMEVSIDGNLVLSDSVNNRYLSFLLAG